MHTDYIFPSENGLRCDVSQLQIGPIHVVGEFHFSVSRFGFEQLSAATHYNELAPEVGLHLCLDGYHMGVGMTIRGRRVRKSVFAASRTIHLGVFTGVNSTIWRRGMAELYGVAMKICAVRSCRRVLIAATMWVLLCTNR